MRARGKDKGGIAVLISSRASAVDLATVVFGPEKKPSRPFGFYPKGLSGCSPSNETPLELGIVLYPGMTLLDFAGPQCALGLQRNTHLLWKTLEPVKTDEGISVLPTSTFASSRRDFDVLLVLGGMGAADAIKG